MGSVQIAVHNHNKVVLSQRKMRVAGTTSLAIRRPKPQRYPRGIY